MGGFIQYAKQKLSKLAMQSLYEERPYFAGDLSQSFIY